MYKNRLRITIVLLLLVSLLALYASLSGILDKAVYGDTVKSGHISRFLEVGSIAQDIVSIPTAILLVIFSFTLLMRPGFKVFVAALGLNWYFFYGYGLYTIQGQYTSLYVIYLAIFGLSFYSMVFGILSLKTEEFSNFALPGWLRKAIAAFLIFIMVVLVPLWLSFLSADVAKHVPRETYGVFILDLALVFPALAITALLLFKKEPLGNIFAGIALLKILTLCLSVGFGEWFQAYYGGLPLNTGGFAIFSLLTIMSLVLYVPYMLKYKRVI